MLRTMAASLLPLQGSDGFWRASLADHELYAAPETSATALITYALAYGIKAGLLDAPTNLPAVARAWTGLSTRALQPSGFVTDCQGPGIAPAALYTATAPRVAPTSTSAGTVNSDSPRYCAGAFLLAGTAVAGLTSSPSTGRPITFTSQQVGNEARHIDDGDVTTRWSASPFPQAVTIDLGADYRVSNSMVVPYQDRAYRYRIDVSTDGHAYTTVATVDLPNAEGPSSVVFPKIDARWVRIQTMSSYSTSTVAVEPFEVFASTA